MSYLHRSLQKNEVVKILQINYKPLQSRNSTRTFRAKRMQKRLCSDNSRKVAIWVCGNKTMQYKPLTKNPFKRF